MWERTEGTINVQSPVLAALAVRVSGNDVSNQKEEIWVLSVYYVNLTYNLLLCAYACMTHIHTCAHARTHTHVRMSEGMHLCVQLPVEPSR